MADARTKLEAIVTADTEPAVREFKRAGNEIDRAMDRASNSTEKLDNAMVKLARGAVGGLAFREITQFSMSLVKSTAQLEDTIAAAGVTFGEYTTQIEEFAKSAARNFGISKVAALDAANTFAALGKSAGLSGQELAGFSTEMVSLAGDLASFRGTSVEDAIMAIGSGLRGEQEPLRRFGVLLDDATLKARAMAMGIFEGSGSLTAQQKVLAAQAEILAQTGDAQGDFARTADSTANSMKTATAEFENAKAAAGEALAPALTALSQSLTPVLQGFSALPSELQTVTVNMSLAAGAFTTGSQALQGLGVATSTANGVMGGLSATIGIATTLYALYAQEKAEATRRTNEFADALEREGPDQESALFGLAENDEQFAQMFKVMNDLGITIQDLEEYATEGSGAIDELIKSASTEVGGRGVVTEVDKLAESLGVSEEALQIFITEVIRVREANRDAANAQRALNIAAVEGASISMMHARAMGLSADRSDDVTGSLDDQRDSIDQTVKKIQAANDAYQEQLDLIEELYGDQRDAIQRQLDYADAMVDYAEAVGDADASVRDQLDSAIQLSEQFATLNGATLDSEEGVNRQVEAFDQMLATLEPGSPLYEALLEYRNQLDAIPETVNTLVNLGLPQGSLLGAGIATTGGMNPTMLKTATGDLAAGGSYGTGPVNLVVNVYEPVADGVQIANALAAYIRRNGTRFLAGRS